jgi:hypothetical protein
MMFSRIALPLTLFAACGMAAAQQTSAPASQVPHSQRLKSKRTKPVSVQASTPVAASPTPVYTPPTPENMPAQPPQVSYAGGMLTIVAANSTLGDILNLVKSRTGATIDAPGAMSERVATQLGPAPPREVLADLLKGSPYDYVMVGSDSDPQGIRNIILTRNSSAPAASGPATASGVPPQPGGMNNMLHSTRGGPAAAQPPEEPVPDAEVEQPEEPTAAPEQVAPPHNQGQIGAPGQQMIQPQPPDVNHAGRPLQPAPPAQPGQPDQRLRSPEELLQELQRMQQQQQQQQQEQEQQQ